MKFKTQSEAEEFAHSIGATHIFENKRSIDGWVYFMKSGSLNPIIPFYSKEYFSKLDVTSRIIFMAQMPTYKSDLYYDIELETWFAELDYSKPDFSIIPDKAIELKDLDSY